MKYNTDGALIVAYTTLTAGDVDIVDAGAHYVATEVESALQELGHLTALTVAEVDQLENIGVTTISAAQWGYLGLMNQGVASTDSPQWDHYLRGSIATYQTSETYVNNVIQKTDTLALVTLANQNDIAFTDFDVNTAGSLHVPAKANAVILETMFADSGFPAGVAYGIFRKKGEVDVDQQQYAKPDARGEAQRRTVIVGLDNNGIMQYSIVASGANTADLYLRLVGWIEPA